MSSSGDFRAYAFDVTRVNYSGRDIGHTVYWKLYVLENLIRVVVNSVLSVQANRDWWNTTVDPNMRGSINGRKKDYAKDPRNTTPGSHDIYYAYLSDLGKIIATNSHLFEPIIKDIDTWVVRIEQIRIPRNIVGHMNWPSKPDRQRIDDFYSDFHQLVQKLISSGFRLINP